MTDLPEGWEEKSIKEIFAFKYGKGLTQEKRSAGGGIAVYGSNGIVGDHDQAITRGATIIVGRKGSVGEVHLSPEKCWPIDTTYFIDEFPEGSPPKYWALLLKSLRLGQQDKSSAIPGISREDIYKLTVPVPPIDEQSRIVAKLEHLLRKVDACQKRLAKIPAVLKRFRQSVLAAAFTGRLTEDWRSTNSGSSPWHAEVSEVDKDSLRELPASWKWANLESVCEYIVDCPHSTPVWTNAGFVCARTSNFKRGLLDLTDIRYVSEETYRNRTERLIPVEGDVLYSREGAILGIACMVPCGIELCMGQRMMLFRTNEEYLSTLLMHWLNSPQILKRVRELNGGSASPHLNVRRIRAFPVPLPVRTEQEEIVRRVNALFKVADQIEARRQRSQAHVHKLTQSILAKAFRGDLVTTEAELAQSEDA